MSLIPHSASSTREAYLRRGFAPCAPGLRPQTGNGEGGPAARRLSGRRLRLDGRPEGGVCAPRGGLRRSPWSPLTPVDCID